MFLLPCAIEAGLIGDQADALALQRREILLLQNVEAGEHAMIGRDIPMRAGPMSVSL